MWVLKTAASISFHQLGSTQDEGLNGLPYGQWPRDKEKLGLILWLKPSTSLVTKQAWMFQDMWAQHRACKGAESFETILKRKLKFDSGLCSQRSYQLF